MGDNYYGLAVFVKVNENVHYIVCGVFVKRRCRFIGKYYIRAVDNGSCKRNTLFLTSGKLFYGLFQKIGYKHIFRRLGYRGGLIAFMSCCSFHWHGILIGLSETVSG